MQVRREAATLGPARAGPRRPAFVVVRASRRRVRAPSICAARATVGGVAHQTSCWRPLRRPILALRSRAAGRWRGARRHQSRTRSGGREAGPASEAAASSVPGRHAEGPGSCGRAVSCNASVGSILASDDRLGLGKSEALVKVPARDCRGPLPSPSRYGRMRMIVFPFRRSVGLRAATA